MAIERANQPTSYILILEIHIQKQIYIQCLECLEENDDDDDESQTNQAAVAATAVAAQVKDYVMKSFSWSQPMKNKLLHIY